ncbi:MAG: autotransporter-associated beta strand repeat-containing protein [Verrucomicrobiota bacterium]
MDVGRGIALDMTSAARGCEMYSTQPGIFDAKGTQIYANNIWAPEAIWWDADLLREFEDGAGSGALNPVINKFNPTTGGADRIYTLYNEDGGCHQAYGGRAALWGDLFGDWREEFMVVANDFNSVRIYTTKIQAANRLYCLMQNPQYRVQSTFKGYYQASYVDYYLGTDMASPVVPPLSDAKLVWRGSSGNVWDEAITASWFTNNLWVSNNTAVTYTSGDTVLFDVTGSNNTAITLSGSITPADVRVHAPKDYTFEGPGELTGTMKLTKAGAGKLTFNGTNTYSGATCIDEGSFIINGSLPNTSVTVRGGVWLDGRLGGIGILGSAVRFEEGGGFSPGPGTNAPGTLTINSNVIFAARTYSDFDLSDDPSATIKANDLVNISGNLTLQGLNTITIHKLNATLPPGVYPLINYSGSLTGSLANLVIAGLPGVPVALTNSPGQIALVVKNHRPPATINWTGGSSGNVWDLLTTSNFLNSGVKDQFAPGDIVRFDSIGTSNLTVNLSGDLNASAVIVDSTANYTLASSGGIIGASSLTKSNTGTLTISTLNNSYSGKTTIAGGTVVVSELDAAGYASPFGSANSSPTNFLFFGSPILRVTGESYSDRGMTLNTGTNTIEVANATDQVTLAGLLTGSGAFQKAGSGTLAITRSNNFSGVSIISAGTLSLGGDEANQYGFGANGTGTVILNGGTINMYDNSGSYNSCSWTLNVPTGASGTLNADSRVDYYGALTGGGALTFRTPYVRTTLFGNWSAFTGQINVTTDSDGGDFRISNSSGYANATIYLSSLVYAYHTTSSTAVNVGALSGAAGSVLSGGAWNVGGKNTDTTFAGNITGTSVIKSGTGTWTLTGTNSYSGTTTVSAGTLMIDGDSSPAKGNVTVNASATLAGTGSLGGAVICNGKLTPGHNAIGTLTSTNNFTFSASSSAIIEINKTSSTRDLLDIDGTLTYGGTLQVTNLSGSLTNGDSFKIFNAGTYAGAFSSYNLPTLATGLVWNISTLALNGTLSVGVTNSTGAKAIVWKGDGTVNTWDINTSANWLDTNSNVAFFANNDTVTFSDAGSNNVPIVLSAAVQPAAIMVTATKDYVITGNGSIGGTNSLTKSGSGNLTLSTTNGYTGTTTINAGTLTVANLGAGLRNRWSFNGSLVDSVGGQTATVVDVGANNTTLSASQITLTGGAQASSDYVDLGDQILPNGTTPVTIELWATPLSVQNWARIFDFGSATTENLFMSWTRGTTLTQDRVEWVDTAGTTTSNDTCQPYTLGVEFHIAMVIEPSVGTGGTTRVTWYRAASTNSTIGATRGWFDTTNTLAMLNDTNCWLGRSQWPDNTANASYNEVRIWNRALSTSDLQALHTSGPDTAFGAGLPSSTTVTLTGATAKLDLQNGIQNVASLTGVAGSEVKLTAANLTVGSDNTSTTFAGIFSGTNGFTKTGTGTFTLAGNSTLAGPTTVTGGTLLMHGNNSAATGAVLVSSSAILGGNGILGNPTTIAVSGTLAPGSGIGAITFTNALTLGGTTVIEISHTPLTNDVVNKTGTFTYGGALVITNISGTLAAGDSFKLFNATAYVGSFSSITLPTLGNGLIWSTNALTTSGTISAISAVSTTPTNLNFIATGNSLTLSWPASHTGWTLQAQTNTLNTGLSATWHPIAGSTATNAMTFPVNPANPTVFYRLTYP